MSFKTRVEKAEPIVGCYNKNSIGVTLVVDGIPYWGSSKCREEDADFFSERVGMHLAHLRAEYEAFNFKKWEYKREYETLARFMKKIEASWDMDEADPFDAFRDEVKRIRGKYKYYTYLCENKAKEIKKYLEDQEKAIGAIKRGRENND